MADTEIEIIDISEQATLPKRSRITQRMANEFPEWSRVRTDEQSLGYQLLNIFGNRIEDTDRQLVNIGKNHYISTVNLDEIDSIFQYQLPGNFEFTLDETDTSNIIQITPFVGGEISGDWYDTDGLVGPTIILNIATDNDIETFWYNSIPSRLAIDETVTSTHEVLATAQLAGTPLTEFNLPHTPGILYITIDGGDTFLATVRNQLARGLVVIAGLSRKGTEDEETLVFLANETKPTTKEWQEVTSVKVYGIDPNTATISISSANFNNGPYLDFYNLDHGVSGNKVDTFWDIGETENGTHTLDMVRFNTEDPRTLLLGFTAKQTVRQTELLNEEGEVIVPLDTAIQPFSNRFWACSATQLYLFDMDLTRPNMKLMKKKEYDSFSIMEFDSYYKVLNDEVDISYRLIRPIKEISRHKVNVKKPDGVSVGILEGVEVLITSDYWVEGAVSVRELRPSHTLTLNQRGTYLFTMEVEYLDGTTNIDQRVVLVDSKEALASFSLTGLGANAAGLYFDSDQKLQILDSNGNKHKLTFATDVMLIDYEQKIIFFHEEYDNVSVIA